MSYVPVEQRKATSTTGYVPVVDRSLLQADSGETAKPINFRAIQFEQTMGDKSIADYPAAPAAAPVDFSKITGVPKTEPRPFLANTEITAGKPSLIQRVVAALPQKAQKPAEMFVEDLKQGLFGTPQSHEMIRHQERQGFPADIYTSIVDEGLAPYIGRATTDKVEHISSELEKAGTPSDRAAAIAFYDVFKFGQPNDPNATQAKKRLEQLAVTPQELNVLRFAHAGQIAGNILDVAGNTPVGGIAGFISDAARPNLARMLLRAKTEDVAAEILRTAKVPEDLIATYAPKFASLKDAGEVEKGIESLTRTIETTHPGLKGAEATGYVPVSERGSSFSTNDKVLITDKETGKSEIRFVRMSPKNGLTVADNISGIPRKLDVNKFDIELIEKNSAEAPKPHLGINSEEMVAAEKPATHQEAATTYWDQVIKPKIEKKEPIVIAGDDIKAHFGGDYAPEKSDLYSKASFTNVQRAIKEAPGDFTMLAGGPGSGKTELLTKKILEKGYDGILYDNSLSNFEGAKKLITDARAAGKKIRIYGILPDLQKARDFTLTRETVTGRPVTDEAFARGHAGFPAVAKQLLDEKIISPDEIKIYDLRHGVSKEEALKMISQDVSAKNPLDILNKVKYNESEIATKYAAKENKNIPRGARQEDGGAGRRGGVRRSFGTDRADTGSRMGGMDARTEIGVGEKGTREAALSAPTNPNVIKSISAEKMVGPVKDILENAFPKLTETTRAGFARVLAGMKREDDIAALLSRMQRLENQAGKAGQQVLDATMPASVRDIMSRKDAKANIDLLTRQFQETGADKERLHAAAQNEYDKLHEMIDKKAIDRLNEATVEKGIIDDLLIDHPGAQWAKYRLPGMGWNEVQLDELLARGLKSGGKGKDIDTKLANDEFGRVQTLQEAQKELETWLSLREQRTLLKQEISQLKPRVRAGEIARGILEGLPVIPTKQANEIDKLISSATVREFKDISGTMGEFRDVDRNFERFFGKAYPHFKRLILDPLDDAKASFTRGKEFVRNRLKQNVTDLYGISRGSKEDQAIMDWGESMNGAQPAENAKYATDESLVRAFGEKKAEEIRRAAYWFRSQYERGIQEANDTIRKIYPNQPEKLIAHRKDYFRHYQEFGGGFVDAIRNFMDVPSGIDPKLVGLSEFTRPKSRFLSFAQTRLGKFSTRSAIGGYLDYMEALEYLKNIDPQIGKFRYLRRKIAEVAPRAGTSEADRIQPGVDKMLQFLDDFANDLSGKTAPADRYIQKTIPGGRATIKTLNFVTNRIKANTMLGNMGTTFAQLANIPAAIAETKQHAAKGMARAIASIFDPYAVSKSSPFLKERFQTSATYDFPIDFKQHPVRRTEESAAKVLAWILKGGDRAGTELAWNSFYEKYLAENMKTRNGIEAWAPGASPEDAIRFADQKTRRLVAGRGIGEVPLAQKAKILQAVIPFTVEVNNAWFWMGDQVRKKAFGTMAFYLLANYLYNEAADKVRGSRVSYDPINALWEGSQSAIEEAKAGHYGTAAAKFLGRQAGEVLSNISGGQYVSATLPDVLPGGMKRTDFFAQADPNRYGSPLLFGGAIKDLGGRFALPFGGLQIEKTYKGVQALLNEQARTGAGKINFPIARTPANITRAILFGPNATSEANNSFKTGDDVRQRLAIQDRARADLATSAEEEWQKLKDIGKSKGQDAAAVEWNKIKDENPDMLKKLKEIAADEKKGITANDRLIIMLGVANGARAHYIVDQINSLGSKQEKEDLWKEYVKKKIITPAVKTQVLKLLEE